MAEAAVVQQQETKKSSGSFKVKIQKFGSFMSGMVMPNIGAFLAWGIITAFFLETGWTPNETLAELIDPTLTYLIPILLGYTGGTMVYDRRGGVIGAIATMGVVIGADVTMLIGAMVMGPLAAWLMKKVDEFLKPHVHAGFEMLVDNFSIGILGALLMIVGSLIIQPIFTVIMNFLTACVDWVVDAGLTPLAAIFVCPAQVLFLNNAVNHGVLVPLATAQVEELGKSILFYIEADTGYMTGVLLAFAVFGHGVYKSSAPGTIIIVMFGGIAEVYFPYILAKPKMILASIAGSMAAIWFWGTFGGGAVASPSPGSIIAFVMVSEKSSLVVNLIGWFLACAVSFVVGSILLKMEKNPEDDESEAMLEESIASAQATVNANMGSGETAAVVTAEAASAASDDSGVDYTAVKHIYVCCDAGMGSSAMGASVLQTKLNKAALDIKVDHASISAIPDDADMVITLEPLMERALASVSGDVIVCSVDNFLSGDDFDEIVNKIQGK